MSPRANSLPLISRMLLKQWQKEAPEKLLELKESGELIPFLEQANEQTIDLLYELTVIQKRDYATALRMAIEWSSLAPQQPH